MSKYMMLMVAATTLSAASAQKSGDEKYVIKASAERSIGNAVSIDSALDGVSSKSSSSNYGIDFGWKIWERKSHSLEANVGLGYEATTVKACIPDMKFKYNAPAEADMDMVPYIRCSELKNLHEKINAQRITLPIYVDYRYRFSKVFSMHALLGFRFAYNVSTKVKDTEGTIFSYGIYPQYDDLMIDATYMNEFGLSEITPDKTTKPNTNPITSAFLTGIGAEFRIFGPLAIDLSMRYEGAMSSIFKSVNSEILEFNQSNAPVTYTVEGGQRVMALSNYYSLSRMSRLSYSISLLCRF